MRILEALQAALSGEACEPLERPWSGWLAIVLCRQRERQRWLLTMHRVVLKGEEEEGLLPGHPGWAFRYHGSGLLLSGPSDERLDVDFQHGDLTGASIDPYFFTHRLLSLADPGLPERRLKGWLCGREPLLIAALDELIEHGVIEHREDSRHVFVLAPELERLSEALARVAFEVPQVAAAWSRRLGEPGEKADPGGSKAFQSWALGLVWGGRNARLLKDLIPVVDHADLTQVALKVLEGPVESGTGRAIEALTALKAVPGSQAVALATRMDPALHNPFSACRLARWLLKADLHVDVAISLILRFSAQRKSPGFRGNPFDSEYAFLALEFLPEHAPPLIKQALLSRVPNSYEKMAAYLSWIEEPWAQELLLTAARESSDDTQRRFLVGCLQYTPIESVAEAARGLLPPDPEFPPEQPGYTFEQVQFLNLRQLVEARRARALGEVRRLRPH